MSQRKIKDAGEKIPFAKKDIPKVSKKSHSDLTLKSLWPQPNWVGMLNSGCDLDVIVYLAVLYNGFRNKPRVRFCDINATQWEFTFKKCIKIMQYLFSQVRTKEDIPKLKKSFYKKLNLSDADFKDNNIDVTYPAYALGRGETRRIYTPFSLTLKQQDMRNWLGVLKWPVNKDAMKARLFPIEFTDGTWALGKPNKRNHTVLSEHRYKDKDSCLNAFKKMYLKKTEKPFNPNKPRFDLDRVKVKKEDITGDDIINDFGFRGIQFGRSMSNVERQLWLNQVYHALGVFADLLNFPNKRWIGLGGLGIAFGARGAGKAMAHYESSLRAINLTRRSGSGSLAHEWFHALDHHLFKRLSGADKRLKYATKALHYQGVEFLGGKGGVPKHYDILSQFFKLSRYEKSDCQFIKQARNLTYQHGGRKYWSSTIEVYARCFETYIQDKLIKMNIDCPWLVIGTLEEDYPQEQHHKHPYPIGAERKKFYEMWERFFHSLFNPSR